MEDYIKCELIGGRSPRYLNTFLKLVYCCCTHIYLYIVDCTHVVSARFLQGLGSIAQENTTAGILVEDELGPPLDMLTVEQERKNSTTKCKSIVVVRIINISCLDNLTTFTNFFVC